MKKILLICLLSLVCNDANAYLDPGSGNALLCMFFSLLGAMAFYIRTFISKLLRFINSVWKKNKENNEEEQYELHIAILSEGKNYWYTYKPILDELIARKIHFIYYSMDIEDPALVYDNKYLHSKYIGKGGRAYAKVGSLKVKLLITTTPNIGCSDYPLKKPAHINKLVHIWHSVCDSSGYHLGALDYYDVALTVGDWVEKSLRDVEKIRNINKKEIYAVGLPYLDELKSIHEVQEKVFSKHDEYPVILLAPSWGQKCCLKMYGTKFIDYLLKNGYRVIIRPHPQSLKVERNLISLLENMYSNNSNVFFDFEPDGSESMKKSSIMISDNSGVRFDYAFIYEKPVLTLDVPGELLTEYEACLLGRHWGENESSLIGVKLSMDDLKNSSESNEQTFLKAVNDTMNFSPERLKFFRSNIIKNFGCSATKITDWIEKEISVKSKC